MRVDTTIWYHCLIYLLWGMCQWKDSSTFQWALSFCVEKPAVPVENQTERSFTWTFSGKRKTFGGIPFFSVLTELPEYHCTICAVILVPCSLFNWRRQWMGEHDSSVVKYCSILGGKFSPVFPTNGKRSSRSILLVEKSHCSIWQKVLTGFPKIETAISLNFRRKKILHRCVVSSRGSPAVWTGRIQPSRDVFDICLE